MSSKWKNFKLSEFCTKIGSGATPTGGKSSYSDDGEIALIRSQNVLDFVFSYDGLAYINSKQAKKLSNVEIETDDVLINITGDSVARVCKVPENIIPARVNQHVSILRVDKSKFSSELLKYLLLVPENKNRLLSLASSGATRNALTKTMLEDFEVLAPEDVDEQQEIANILKSLDDKIANNNRINQTLEEIAQALFKSWFVDFEPVKAKMQAKAEGTNPQLAAIIAISGKTEEEIQQLPEENQNELAKTANLFPDDFEESELGLIPVKWHIDSLNSISDHLKESVTPMKNGSKQYYHYSLPAFDNGKMPIIEYGTKIKSNKYKLVDRVILISKLNPNTPRIWDVPILNGNNCICSTEFQIVKPKKDIYFEFISQSLKSERVINEHAGKVTGTSKSHQRVRPSDIFETRIVIPDEGLIKVFSKLMTNCYICINNNIVHNSNLALIRETLLPKLLSGELTINSI